MSHVPISGVELDHARLALDEAFHAICEVVAERGIEAWRVDEATDDEELLLAAVKLLVALERRIERRRRA